MQFKINNSKLRRRRGKQGLEECAALGAEVDDAVALWIVIDEAVGAGVFPDGKTGTGGAPGVEDFGVGPGLGGNPFEELQREGPGRFGRHRSGRYFLS